MRVGLPLRKRPRREMRQVCGSRVCLGSESLTIPAAGVLYKIKVRELLAIYCQLLPEVLFTVAPRYHRRGSPTSQQIHKWVYHRSNHEESHSFPGTSNAVVDLDSTYRWCLTGYTLALTQVFPPPDLRFSRTPIINTLSDAFGLIRFLQLRPWDDWKEFNELIWRYEKRRPKLATDRLQTIFKTALLRRNKDTVLDGKKLITLPPKTVELVRLEFCPEEREVYTAVSMVFHDFLS
jgi:hypothetical protein